MEENKEKLNQEELDELRKSLSNIFPEDEVNSIIEKAEKENMGKKKPMYDDDMMKAYNTMKGKMDMMKKAMDQYNIMKGDMDEMSKAMDKGEYMKDMKDRMGKMEKAMTEFQDMYGNLTGTGAHGDDLKKSEKDDLNKSEKEDKEDLEKSEKDDLNKTEKETTADELLKSFDFGKIASDAIEKSLEGLNLDSKFSEISNQLQATNEKYEKIEKSITDMANAPFGKMKAMNSLNFIQNGEEKTEDGKRIIRKSEKTKVIDELEKAFESDLGDHDKDVISKAISNFVVSGNLSKEAIGILGEKNGVEIA